MSTAHIVEAWLTWMKFGIRMKLTTLVSWKKYDHVHDRNVAYHMHENMFCEQNFPHKCNQLRRRKYVHGWNWPYICICAIDHGNEIYPCGLLVTYIHPWVLSHPNGQLNSCMQFHPCHCILSIWSILIRAYFANTLPWGHYPTLNNKVHIWRHKWKLL